MFRITLGSVRVVLGVAAAGLALWGAWKLGTYLAEKASRDSGSPSERGVDPAEKTKPADPLWQRKFSPVSSG